jgi:electron transport complex protein RnfE
MVSSVARFVPSEVRIATYVVIIATFVTIADMVLEAIVPDIHKALGAFVPLIVVNCIILGRAEAFASRNPAGRSLIDALGMSLGYTVALVILSAIRELLGNGTLLGRRILGAWFEPWVIMLLPPGAFITLGVLIAAAFLIEQKSRRRRSA